VTGGRSLREWQDAPRRRLRPHDLRRRARRRAGRGRLRANEAPARSRGSGRSEMKRDRLNSVLTDAAALGGYASCADVRVEVSITTVSVYAVTTTAPTSRIPIISGSRSVEVLKFQ
jgi:hypothetical protein